MITRRRIIYTVAVHVAVSVPMLALGIIGLYYTIMSPNRHEDRIGLWFFGIFVVFPIYCLCGDLYYSLMQHRRPKQAWRWFREYGFVQWHRRVQ
jgi:hypothetical protein